MKAIENNFDDLKVNELLKKHFIELRSVSPAGSTHVLDIDGLKDKTIKFWSIWDNEDLIGCGAIKVLSQNHGEFKSISCLLYTSPSPRDRQKSRMPSSA